MICGNKIWPFHLLELFTITSMIMLGFAIITCEIVPLNIRTHFQVPSPSVLYSDLLKYPFFNNLISHISARVVINNSYMPVQLITISTKLMVPYHCFGHKKKCELWSVQSKQNSAAELFLQTCFWHFVWFHYYRQHGWTTSTSCLDKFWRVWMSLGRLNHRKLTEVIVRETGLW